LKFVIKFGLVERLLESDHQHGFFFLPMPCAARESGVTLSLTPVILPVHLSRCIFAAPETRVRCEKARWHARNLDERSVLRLKLRLGVTLFRRTKKYAALS
jgi:hypothetical protein